MTKLVLIHGRSQQGKDSTALKAEWVASLDQGLGKSDLSRSLADDDIRFPYYGDTLIDMVSGKKADEIAEIVIRGTGTGDDAEQEFVQDVLKEVIREAGFDDDDVRDELEPQVVERGPLNWEWVQAGLRLLDRKVPFASSASIALATRDVYRYLTNEAIRRRLHRGIEKAMEPGVPTVLVSHSLGTVVAYDLLHAAGVDRGWDVPLFITLGSPLGIERIRQRIAPIGHPPCVGAWRNAMDPRDVVALYPLNARNFPVNPPIRNKTDVDNHTSNRHGIAGYLGDLDVARWIHDAVA